MNRAFEIILNIIFWILSLLLIINSFSIEAIEIDIVDGEEIRNIVRSSNLKLQLLIAGFLAMIGFYVNKKIIEESDFQSDKFKTFIKSFLIVSTSFILFFIWIKYFSNERKLALTIIIGLFIFYHIVSTTYGLIKLLIKENIKSQVLINEKKLAELALLRAQLRPHFLFNVLNNLMAMVDQELNPKLADSIDKLSLLLRYVIEETSKDEVKLKDEVKFINLYASLQKLRFEEGEVDFKFSTSGNTNILFEPGLLILLVENAFKFGTIPEKNSIINVNLEVIENRQLIFKICNHIWNKKDELNGTGTGLNSLKNRLDIVYPNRYTLNITNNEKYEVLLKVDVI